MTATGDGAGERRAAERLGFRAEMVVQELGWDDDVDQDLRQSIEQVTGAELVGGDYGDVADAVMLWWREDDGDLVDALVDALTDLADGGSIWLLTPKVGQDGHVDPTDVAEAAPIAGVSVTTTQPAGQTWSATKLVKPKAGRGRR
ncbi:MAG TPA: DUF3052 domain-containing protein [Nocardioidaceae bacterium]|nr:DUF3052 domain-containing protein [Nocardioidaceae bacterium]